MDNYYNLSKIIYNLSSSLDMSLIGNLLVRSYLKDTVTWNNCYFYSYFSFVRKQYLWAREEINIVHSLSLSRSRSLSLFLYLSSLGLGLSLSLSVSLCKGRTLYSVVRDAKVVLDVNKTRQIAQEMVKVRHSFGGASLHPFPLLNQCQSVGLLVVL